MSRRGKEGVAWNEIKRICYIILEPGDKSPSLIKRDLLL
jgi:hypothetical protein